MRILYIDAYDSYTQNLVALFKDNFRERENKYGKKVDEIIVIRHDACEWQYLHGYLPCFDAVVLSPGPGNPNVKKDVRLIADVCTTKGIPIFGVCLGMQSLAVAHGGTVVRMRKVKHGIVSRIEHSANDLFLGVSSECWGTQYHSMHVDMASMPAQLKVLAVTFAKDRSNACLMAFRHKMLPHWGVQYHPDSVCSSDGHTIVKNFLEMAMKFNAAQKRSIKPLPPHFEQHLRCSPEPIGSSLKIKRNSVLRVATVQASTAVDIDGLCRLLARPDGCDDFALLDSAAAPGKWTYLSCKSSHMFRIKYSASSRVLKYTKRPDLSGVSMDEAWRIVKDIMEEHMLATNSPQSEAPFCGGFIGWFSYEAGLKTMGLTDVKLDKNVSDIALLFVERSIALDVASNTIYVHSIASNDQAWVDEIASTLESDLSKLSTQLESHSHPQPASVVQAPLKRDYLDKIQIARDEMRRGNSYEVCLTDQTLIGTQSQDPWQMYLSVRQNNPAPYATFLRLGNETLIGSSPEMFLRCEAGACELRPIKGTLKKSKGIDMQRAEQLLGNEKERAENLMIVDLLRNDLYQVADVGSIQVSQLMAVEEYATVFQLVSSIVGKISTPFQGLDVLARTLPPGSMTGAPKRKTCEILQKLETRPRGVYSGVAGYWSVNDNHLWSVIIRSAYHRCDASSAVPQQEVAKPTSHWTVGAGGALLAVSSPREEWEEMKTKADSVINGLLRPPANFDVLESMFLDDSAADSCPLWSRHVTRLERACHHFGFKAPDPKDIWRVIQEKKIPDVRQKVRLSCQRAGNFKVECQILGSTSQLLNVKLDSVATLVQNFDFVRFKTTMRRHYDEARARTGTTGLDEVLLYDKNGYLMEGSIFNIAVRQLSDASGADIWITPPSSMCLNGIMRDKLLQQGRVIEGEIHKDQLREGQEIMLFNAVRGVCWGTLIL